ncbi:uncharacterized protein [Montipora foliosa]|uniref:uncharacterized protein isoform X1 n=1 Tax=Montipora foliosa TaxID=591990 RepID=UPI0035F16CB4
MSLRVIQLNDLNPHLLCVLCGGYLVDATTIVECLHSFCRSCIVKYLQTSFNCPVCDVEVHKTKPLLHIRPDRTLQDIVYKIVPDIYEEEANRRREFDENQKEEYEQEAEEDKKITTTHKEEKVKESLAFDDPVCITLDYFRKSRNCMEKEIFPTRYLRCSSSVTVEVLKKFLIMKFAIPETHVTEIIRFDEILDGHLSVKEVCRIYGLYSKPFVDLQYVFLEKNETPPVEQPKIVEMKRKRIKRRKGNNNLLKKCLSSNAPRRRRKKGVKKSCFPSVENDGNTETALCNVRPLESERKENLEPSDMDGCANTKREDLVPTQVASVPEHIESVDKERNSLSNPNMGKETSGNLNENGTLAIDNGIVKRLVDPYLTESDLNNIDISPMGVSAVNGSIHASSTNSENALGGFNHANNISMNHVSCEVEPSASFQGLFS